MNELLTLVFWWLLIIPLAGNLIAETLTIEVVFDWLRDWVEVFARKLPVLIKLINCPVCMGYYTTTGVSILIARALLLPEGARVLPGLSFSCKLVIFVVLTLASIRVATALARGKR
jgi:hypothetical protein